MQSTWNLILHTPRLTLRPLQAQDYTAWYQGFAQRLPSQHPYDPGSVALNDCTQAWFAALCQRHQDLAAHDKVYIWGIFSTRTNAHLGHIDLATLRRAEQQWATIGYGIHNQYWRHGFAKEAVAVALQAGFQDLHYHRIEAAINTDNTASLALAHSLGMQYECVRRGFLYEHGAWTDHRIYAAIPTDRGLPEPPPDAPG